jgi:hypothetical protein
VPDRSDLTACPGCGALVSSADGPTHAYYGAAPGCWALYGEVLAREYGDFRYARLHRLTVDAYAAQHPGRPERRTIQSVAVHLIGLHLSLEAAAGEWAGHDLSPVLQAAADRSAGYHWLEPPPSLGDVTVSDVHAAADPVEHLRTVRRWAEHTWAAWAPHHAQVRAWAAAVTTGGARRGAGPRR